MFTQEKWKAMPMLGSPLWGVKDDKGTVIVLGLTEANARFIAAAPETKRDKDDLLTALDQIVKISTVDRGQRKAPSKRDYMNAVIEIHRIAKQSLTKAQ